MHKPNAHEFDELAELFAKFEALCADNPVAKMVLAHHRLDESGQCAECRAVTDAHIEGDDLVPLPALWPCDTSWAVLYAVLGWTVKQAKILEAQCHRQVAARRRGTPLAFDASVETLDLYKAWVTSGIPPHRVLLYTTADIALDEAYTHETAGLTDEDLDGSLATLVALL